MKVEKTIDAHEKSMQKLFTAMTEYTDKYPDDFATMFIGRKVKKDGQSILQSSSFIKDDDNVHFLESHIWQLTKLMEATSPSKVKELFNYALEVYKEIHKL